MDRLEGPAEVAAGRRRHWSSYFFASAGRSLLLCLDNGVLFVDIGGLFRRADTILREVLIGGLHAASNLGYGR